MVGLITDSNREYLEVEELRKDIQQFFVITREEKVCGGNILVSVDLDIEYPDCASIDFSVECDKCGNSDFLVNIDDNPVALQYYIEDNADKILTNFVDKLERRKHGNK